MKIKNCLSLVLSTRSPLFRGVYLTVLIAFLAVTRSFAQSYQPCHDPSSPIYSGGKWWIFTTGTGIYTMNNTTLTGYWGWTSGSTVFSGNGPSWIQNYVSGFTGTFWAPELVASGDSFLCYYACSTFGSHNSCIGLATAKSLSGPWKDKGMVVYSNSITSENAIDPFIFEGYLIYGSFFGGIRMAKLDSLTGKPANSTRIAVASGDCEASAMTKNNSYYYLWINRGACCKGVNSTYHVQVGRSDSITGPFLDKTGKDLNSGGGSNIVTTSGRYIGPGCMGFNGTHAVYHFYDGNDNGNPKLMTATLSYTDDWPVITPQYVVSEIDNLYQNNNDAIVYPNPVNNEFTLNLALNTSSEVSIVIYNSNGKIIYSGKINNLNPGTNTTSFSASNLNMKESGFYILQIKTKDTVKEFRIIKQ